LKKLGYFDGNIAPAEALKSNQDRDREASAWAELLARQDSASKAKKKASFGDSSGLPVSAKSAVDHTPTPTPGSASKRRLQDDTRGQGSARVSPHKSGDRLNGGGAAVGGRDTDDFSAISDGGYHSGYWKTKYMR
jgi:hypothetical protein